MNAQKQVLLQREENETDFDMLETTASRTFTVAFKDRMAEEDRRLQYDDHKYCDTGLCGGFLLRHLSDSRPKSWKKQNYIFRMYMLRCFPFRIIPE